MLDIQRLNETSLLIRFGNKIDHRLPQVIARASHMLRRGVGQYITDLIPSYTTLFMTVDITQISLCDFESYLQKELACLYSFDTNAIECNSTCSKIITIPVLYDVSVAPDLQRMALCRDLQMDDIIGLHSSKTYTVFTLGFAPGFAYMGIVDPCIAEPRLATPRMIEEGSVGIAAEQTGVYPTQSPGGWNIIGRTPRRMMWIGTNGQLNCLVAAGDEVKFQPISLGEYQALKGEVNA